MVSLKKFVAFCFLGFVFLLSLFLFWVSENRVAPILMYHDVRVSEEDQSNLVHTDNFRRQMEYLSKNNYKIFTFDDFIKIRQEGKDIPKKSVVITFDDGYEGIYTDVFPIIQEYRIPIMVYIPSDYIEKEGYLTLNEIKQLVDSDLVTIGSHTITHVYLPEVAKDRQEQEIRESKIRLESLIGKDVNHFSYPVGGFSEEIKKIVKDAGYLSAVTTNRGYDRHNQDLFELKRVSMRNKDLEWYKLWAKYSGYYNILRRSKSPY